MPLKETSVTITPDPTVWKTIMARNEGKKNDDRTKTCLFHCVCRIQYSVYISRNLLLLALFIYAHFIARKSLSYDRFCLISDTISLSMAINMPIIFFFF